MDAPETHEEQQRPGSQGVAVMPRSFRVTSTCSKTRAGVLFAYCAFGIWAGTWFSQWYSSGGQSCRDFATDGSLRGRCKELGAEAACPQSCTSCWTVDDFNARVSQHRIHYRSTHFYSAEEEERRWKGSYRNCTDNPEWRSTRPSPWIMLNLVNIIFCIGPCMTYTIGRSCKAYYVSCGQSKERS